MIDPCDECTKDNRYCRHCAYNPSVRRQGQIAWMPELSKFIIDEVQIYNTPLTRKEIIRDFYGKEKENKEC